MKNNIDSSRFKEALKNKDLIRIKQIPKADLHNHAGLGMRFESFKKWCKADIPPPPNRMKGIEGMNEYMGITATYVTSREGFEYLLTATLEAAIEDGVTLIEPSIDCSWIKQYGGDLASFKDFIVNSKERFKDSIDFRPEVGVFKGIREEDAKKYLIPCIDSQVFNSIDFYGEEKWYQPNLTKYYSDLCRERNIKVKIHTGEFSDAKSVRDIIKYVNPMELQHGINAYQDNSVVDLIKEKGIRLNICPSSNVILGAVKSIAEHPIRYLFDQGVKVTVNTDDLLFFHKSVSEELLYLYETGIFNEEELDIIRLNGLI